MSDHRPLIYVHPDSDHLSIRFSDQTSGDTLLKIGGQRGSAGWRDKEIAIEWAEAVEAALSALDRIRQVRSDDGCPLYSAEAMCQFAEDALACVPVKGKS